MVEKNIVKSDISEKSEKKSPGIISGLNATKVKAIILSLVIAIVLSAFVIYLTESIYPSPNYEDYCDNIRPKPIYDDRGQININESECLNDGGTWRYGSCDFYYECNQKFQVVDEKYKLVVFVISAIAGLIAVALGIILGLPSVSSGLMLGGTFLTIYGASQYWTNLTNWVRALLLGVILMILIWLAYRKLKI